MIRRSIMLLFCLGLPVYSQSKPATPKSAPTQAKSTRTATALGPTALLESARQSSAQGKYSEAITKLSSALELAPNSTELLFDYGVVGLRLGKPAETVRSMAAATRL